MKLFFLMFMLASSFPTVSQARTFQPNASRNVALYGTVCTLAFGLCTWYGKEYFNGYAKTAFLVAMSTAAVVNVGLFGFATMALGPYSYANQS